MTIAVTHLVIADYVDGYDGPAVHEFGSEAEAIAMFDSLMNHAADVWLVEVRRRSEYTARRVAESVDQ